MTRDPKAEPPAPSLSGEDVDQLRQQLESELGKLLRSMEITDEAARPVELDQQAVGRLSRMDSLQNQHLTQNLKEREQVRVAALSRALQRMNEGTYGKCTGCGEGIQAGRLFVFPEAERCTACPE